MQREGQCRSYTPSEQICRDGFPVNAACFGARCWDCGEWSAVKHPPACIREDLGPHWFDERGYPRLAKNK